MNYPNTKEGKATFVYDVINPLVQNEEHFDCARYQEEGGREYIVLYDFMGKPAAKINVTLDSIPALARDFCNQFLGILNKM